MKTPLLETKNIIKEFPGVRALDNINFNLYSGEIHALMGENGAGKSTLVKILSGILQPTKGDIFLKGKKIRLNKPALAIKKGIGIVSQESNLVPYFTPVENIFLGQEYSSNGIIKKGKLDRKFDVLIEQLNIDIPKNKEVQHLGVADQKLVEILRVLNLNPEIMILDEPTASLDKDGVDKLFSLMEKLKDNVGIIFISHYIDEIFRIADRVTVLRNGKQIDTRKIKNISENELIKMMIEDKAEGNLYPSKNNDIGSKILEANNINNEFLNDVSFNIRKGEIVGFAGLVGAGRTELAETIFGVHKYNKGKIKIYNENVKIKNTKKAIEKGICLIPEKRREKALVSTSSVFDNMNLSSFEKVSDWFLINENKMKKNSNNIKEKMNIVTSSLKNEVQFLSGGNQQKVSFSKWIINNQDYDIYIFDEPAQGIDVGAKREMFQIIVDLAEQKAGIILISSDLNELLELSDRIYVMSEGSIVDELSIEEANKEKILSSFVGKGGNENE